MITIYHNPRCRKSREGLALVEASGKNFEVIKYLENPISVETLTRIITKLNIKPIDLVRKNEALWKQNYKEQTLSDTELIEILVLNPKLIERPIVINGNKAAIGRPPELILDIL